MEHLIFSLNATMPIFFLMVLGACFRKAGIMEGVFVDRVNQFVFKVALPVLLFEDLSNSDFLKVWDTRFVLFCFVSTLEESCWRFFCPWGLRTGGSEENSYRLPTAAARLFWELPSLRTYMGMREWRLL